MGKRTLIVGGGIGGLAAALASYRAGAEVELFERAAEFSEVGAGIQLGPNVTRILHSWDLSSALEAVAAFPDRLQVRSAISGAELGDSRLGAVTVQRYGSPYVTIHRADLHFLLFGALKQQTDVRLHMSTEVQGFARDEQGIRLKIAGAADVAADLLVGADGLWSTLRQKLLGAGKPLATGHLAYRALLPQSSLAAHLRSQQVTLWLGPKMHVVQYPVRRGELLNVVAIVEGRMLGDADFWDHSANAGRLQKHMTTACTPLQDLIRAIVDWRLWPLNIRPPMRGPQEQAQHRVALLGDAAHPMLPYLAQGAGMAIEDAQALGQVLAADGADVEAALKSYANARWRRNARVQRSAIRNGQIFHASGVIRWGRDAIIRLLGERLLDPRWLYRGPL
jgi:salicylate hydroxylase